MNKLEQHERGLDQAFNEVLEQREADILRREMLEDRILTDEETFIRLAMLYAHKVLNEPGLIGFMDWAVDVLLKEETPEHEHGWEDEKVYKPWDVRGVGFKGGRK